jgi:hypothetical protein
MKRDLKNHDINVKMIGVEIFMRYVNHKRGRKIE